VSPSRAVSVAAAAAVAVLLASACTFVGGESRSARTTTSTTTSTRAATTTEAQQRVGRAVHIEVITHGQAADPFWAVVKNGIEQASRDLGVDVAYRAPDIYDPTRMRQLVEAAVATRPDGLVVSVPDARALAPALRKAERAGIPVVVINSGDNVFRRLGAQLFVGQPEYPTGLAAGRRMGAEGVRDALCIDHQRGVASLAERCRGFATGLAETGGRSRVLFVQAQDQRGAQRRIAAALARDRRVDGVLALGPAGAAPALAALEERGALRRIALGTFDLTPQILDGIRLGWINFAIDQQPYLQGYLPVAFLTQRALYGLMPADGTTIPTGPSFVTKANVVRVLRLTERGIR
jgi:simple sugar transport system substrate-binding protein